jgi:hypothetical protein
MKREEHPQVKKHFEDVRSRFFPQGEMKSSWIGSDDSRRTEILNALIVAPFVLYVLVVEKEQLLNLSPGYAYPKSFVKNLLGKLVAELVRDDPNMGITCDKIKNDSFMEEVLRYLENRYPKSLFEAYGFKFVDSISDVCVQAADIFAGSVARCWERTKRSSENDEFMRIMDKKFRFFDVKPSPVRTVATTPQWSVRTSDDYAIERRALGGGRGFCPRICGQRRTREAMAG